ncbi:hypothetical protein QAD02_009154 [Eretmocerus hayati]|uniref:Uncharacterized protein n=1 Tax=Eretmocerus hayati TaxID=131215 RepID=A0ACC2N8V6_9HYME|nr:hypothetical protein QAD02_009154 [Eretmocerus hayati]
MSGKDDDSSSGDSTDIYSEKFDPLKALYSDQVCVPVPDAPVFDNLSKFESVVLKGVEVKPSTGKKSQKKEEGSGRKFLPHQLPVAGTSKGKSKNSHKNVLVKMRRALGPLATLYQYMENRIKVKVYTRNEHGIRGHVEAYVAAFDKHWNLALEDCLEIWTRKVKRKVPALGIPIKDEDLELYAGPKVVVRERKGKHETVERYVPQLLLRGDQVVLVAKLD